MLGWQRLVKMALQSSSKQVDEIKHLALFMAFWKEWQIFQKLTNLSYSFSAHALSFDKFSRPYPYIPLWDQ